MRSFTDKSDNRRAVYLNLVGSIESQLRAAYERRHEKGQESRADLARKLDVHRSVITRRLTGGQNMTIETVADMVWALGQCIQVEIFEPEERQTNGILVIPDHREHGGRPQVETTRLSLRENQVEPAGSTRTGGARVVLRGNDFQKGTPQPCQ